MSKVSGSGPVRRFRFSAVIASVSWPCLLYTSPVAEADLARAAGRGVDVRVILDQHLERSRNTGAYDYLAARGVHVTWAPAGTTYHQKTLTDVYKRQVRISCRPTPQGGCAPRVSERWSSVVADRQAMRG